MITNTKEAILVIPAPLLNKYQAILHDKKLLTLFLSSLVVSCLWQYLLPTCFTSDSIDYLLWARGIVGMEDGKFAPYRTPGYPLLLLVTGVVHFKTFQGILVLQTLMATAIPLLTYGIVSCYAKKWATLSGFLVLFSTIPLMYSTHIMTDHTSMFLLYVFLFIACRYFWSGKIPSYPAVLLLTFVGWFDALVRPANMLIFYIAIFATLLFHFRNLQWWKRAAVALACYLLLNTAWVTIDSLLWIEGKKTTFTRVYEKILSDHIQNEKYTDPIFDPDHDPATKEFVDQLQAAIYKYPQNWIPLTPEKQYGAYRDNQAELVKRMTTTPSIYYRSFIPALVNEAVSAQPSTPSEPSAQKYRHLLQNLAAEHGVHRIKLTPKSMLFGVPTGMDGKLLFFQAAVAAPYYNYNWNNPVPVFITAANGPSSKYFFDLLLFYLNEYPETWNSLGPPGFYDKYRNSPEELVQNIINKPGATYWWFMWSAMDSLLGAEASTTLFGQVAIEASRVHPLPVLLLIWDNFISALFGPAAVNFNHQGREAYLPNANFTSFTNSTIIPYQHIIGEPLVKEIIERTTPNEFSPYLALNMNGLSWKMLTINYRIWFALRPFLFIIVTVSIIFALISKARIFCAFGSLLVLSQTLIMSILIGVSSRYEDFLLPLLIMLAVIGIVNAMPSVRNGVRDAN